MLSFPQQLPVNRSLTDLFTDDPHSVIADHLGQLVNVIVNGSARAYANCRSAQAAAAISTDQARASRASES